MIEEFWREPDTFSETRGNFSLVARRNTKKAWCGYVGVSPSHPLFNKDYDERVPVPSREKLEVNPTAIMATFLEALHEDDGCCSISVLANVHGGLTYAHPAWWDEFDPRWYFGFDCAHSGDLTPYAYYTSDFHYGEYRNLAYVKENLETLYTFLESF